MSIDKNDLARARSWAEDILEKTGWAPSDHTKAAAKVIQALPDSWVDADRVVAMLNVWRGHLDRKPQVSVPLRVVFEDVESLLPTPAPKVVVRMGAWAQHPEEGKVMIVSAKPDPDGEVAVAYDHGRSATGSFLAWVKHTDLSPLPDDEDDEPEDEQFITYQQLRERYGGRNKHTRDWLTEHYAPGGILPGTEDDEDEDRAEQEPEDEPEFDPACLYEDVDGDIWRYVHGAWRWSYESDGVMNGEYTTPPADGGPYTRIDEGDS